MATTADPTGSSSSEPAAGHMAELPLDVPVEIEMIVETV
jgi:hypothetical protein